MMKMEMGAVDGLDDVLANEDIVRRTQAVSPINPAPVLNHNPNQEGADFDIGSHKPKLSLFQR